MGGDRRCVRRLQTQLSAEVGGRGKQNMVVASQALRLGAWF